MSCLRVRISLPDSEDFLSIELFNIDLTDSGASSPTRDILIISDTGRRIRRLSGLSEDGSSDRLQANLQWYFERYPIRESFANSRANVTQDELRQLGESLLENIFTADVLPPQVAESSLIVEIHDSLLQDEAGKSPWFGQIPWEILEDSVTWSILDEATSFKPRSCHVVRVHESPETVQRQATASKMSPAEKHEVGQHVIAVTARPFSRDIPHRLITRSILNAVDMVNSSRELKASLQIVRPGTFDALESSLKEHPNGYYDILHLDMHGLADDNG